MYKINYINKDKIHFSIDQSKNITYEKEAAKKNYYEECSRYIEFFTICMTIATNRNFIPSQLIFKSNSKKNLNKILHKIKYFLCNQRKKANEKHLNCLLVQFNI